MREIKFRAWDEDFKYMNYKVMVGNVWDDDNYHTHMMWIEPKTVDYECEPHWANFDGHSNIKLMQFTGLHDRNGKEIYEGDIIEIIDENINADFSWREEVIFHNGCFMSGDDDLLINLSYRSVVIGNIYENPELLEGATHADNE